MQIALANPTHIPEIVSFFNENLDSNNSKKHELGDIFPSSIFIFYINE